MKGLAFYYNLYFFRIQNLIKVLLEVVDYYFVNLNFVIKNTDKRDDFTLRSSLIENFEC